jgi:hypothetical protein
MPRSRMLIAITDGEKVEAFLDLVLCSNDILESEAGVAGAQPMRGGLGGCPPDTPSNAQRSRPIRDAQRRPRRISGTDH